MRTMIEIHNYGLPGKGEIDSFYLDVDRIIGNFHFPLFQWEHWEHQLEKRQISFWRRGLDS